MLQNRYDYTIVNKIANEFGNVNINVKHEVHFSKSTFTILILLILVGGGIYSFMNFDIFSKSESLLDVSVNAITYSYIPGESINYQIYITNMGSSQRFDAIIKTLIVDDAGTIITRKEETIAVETTSSVNRNIPLPKNTPIGKYYVKVIADYDGKQATSSSEIEVVKSATDKKPQPGTGSTGTQTGTIGGNKPNTGSTSGSTSTNSGSSTETGNVAPISNQDNIDSTSFSNLLTNIQITAKNSPDVAQRECGKILSESQKDICYELIASTSNLPQYCSSIADSVRSDNCYLTFAMKGNAEVCNNIIEENSKSFCEQLKLVKLMDQYYAEGDSEKVLELSKQFNPSIYNYNPEITNSYTYTEEYYKAQEDVPDDLSLIFNDAGLVEEEQVVENITEVTIEEPVT